jgi:hypothetical protein
MQLQPVTLRSLLIRLGCWLSVFASVSFPCRDEHYGFQLYQSDPSGNYGGWKAVAIGGGHQAAQNLLKTEYKEDTKVGGGMWGT